MYSISIFNYKYKYKLIFILVFYYKNNIVFIRNSFYFNQKKLSI